MSRRRLLAFTGALLLGGCIYNVQERADQAVCDLAAKPFDQAPPVDATPSKSASDQQSTTSNSSNTVRDPAIRRVAVMDAQTTGYLQPDPPQAKDIKTRLQVPPELPGSEAPAFQVPKPTEDMKAREQEIRRLFPQLPPLPDEPIPLPGPNGQPYTLTDLQRVAAENSPQLRQAASDVEAARGNLIQAGAYPNPTVGYEADPSNDGSTTAVQGFFIDQVIKTFGKLKLQSAAAARDLLNAELALQKARTDLATQVRNAYFGVLVAKETVRVTKALARFTDNAYLFQADLSVTFAAPYEPAALRSQAYQARLAYKQAIQNYVYSWKQLVTAVGLRQMPLTEVAGRVDRAIPNFDYDVVLGHVLRYHTDLIAARNGIDKARYALKSAQIAPYPDVEVRVAFLKEYALPPFQYVNSAQVSFPIPIWDQNKGAKMAAEAGLMRATEEPHRVEKNLTNSLETAYQSYKSNLDALEYYRRFILPDQVRTYKGVFARRELDPNVAFADLMTAQQNLAQNITTYLTVLGQLWTSVVSVADLLQTDDLFQLAKPTPLEPVPELDCLPAWPCAHPCATSQAPGSCVPSSVQNAAVPAAPASAGLPRQLPLPAGTIGGSAAAPAGGR